MWSRKKVDVIRRDLKDIEMDESKWYEEATTSRAGWKAAYRLGLKNNYDRRSTEHPVVAACEVVSEVCSRKFRRESVKKRHKCTSEREKPVCEQHGATQCTDCSGWFRSRGGLAVHTYRPGIGHSGIGV